jgi:hypothetical protein
MLMLLPRAVAAEKAAACCGDNNRAGVVTWTNSKCSDSALKLNDGLLPEDSFFESVKSCSRKDAVVSFARRGLARLPPDMSVFCASLVIFSCAGNNLQRLDFGTAGLPNLRQLDCRCVCW